MDNTDREFELQVSLQNNFRDQPTSFKNFSRRRFSNPQKAREGFEAFEVGLLLLGDYDPEIRSYCGAYNCSIVACVLVYRMICMM